MFKNYLKTAYRNLLRHKGFTFINIAGLSFGLTACLLIALFVWDEKQFDTFVPEGERVYRLYSKGAVGDNEGENLAFTPPMYAPSLKQEFPEVAEATRALHIQSKVLFEAGEKKLYEEKGLAADPNFFQVLPLNFIWGTAQGALSNPASVVLSQTMAARLFGNVNPVGKEVLISTEPYQVRGVFEENPKFHLPLTFLIPLVDLEFPEERMQKWTWQQFFTYVKLKEGVKPEALQAKFDRLAKEKTLAQEPDSELRYQPKFQALADIHLYSADFKYDMAVRGNATYVQALSLIAIFILLIACFNFVNLATAKSLQRAKEVGVRKTIGASRRQLVLQFLSETVLLTFGSILLAVGLTLLFLPWLNAFTGKTILFNPADPLILLLLLGLTLLVGILAGLYPALVLSGFQPVKVLKGNISDSSKPGRTPWLRHSLVVVQFAISILLIISAVVVYRQVEYLNSKDLGFEKEQLMFFPMRGDNMFENYQTFKSELLQVPGVSSVSIGYGFPGDLVAGDGIMVPRDGESKNYPVTQLMVDYDYLATLGVELVAGRNFSPNISTDAHNAFIINETAVKDLGFGTAEAALGQELTWQVWSDEVTDSLKQGRVIGVVKDFHYKSLYDRMEPAVLQIFPPAYWKVAVKVETAALTGTLAQVEGVWNKFSPEYPLEYNFLDERFTKMYEAEAKLKILLWLFTGIAIFVGCLGLFGLAAYAAERRTKEIGIRKVLGASEGNIVALLSRDFVKLVLVAVLIASPIAWYFMQQWLQDFAYRVDIGWWVFALAGLAAVAIALFTVSFHAIKAAMRNPVTNLRTE